MYVSVLRKRVDILDLRQNKVNNSRLRNRY